eukprot:9252396-Pyramimonas_sp.AAC.1
MLGKICRPSHPWSRYAKPCNGHHPDNCLSSRLRRCSPENGCRTRALACFDSSRVVLSPERQERVVDANHRHVGESECELKILESWGR